LRVCVFVLLACIQGSPRLHLLAFRLLRVCVCVFACSCYCMQYCTVLRVLSALCCALVCCSVRCCVCVWTLCMGCVLCPRQLHPPRPHRERRGDHGGAYHYPRVFRGRRLDRPRRGGALRGVHVANGACVRSHRAGSWVWGRIVGVGQVRGCGPCGQVRGCGAGSWVWGRFVAVLGVLASLMCIYPCGPCALCTLRVRAWPIRVCASACVTACARAASPANVPGHLPVERVCGAAEQQQPRRRVRRQLQHVLVK
jgi:hypothetical protein